MERSAVAISPVQCEPAPLGNKMMDLIGLPFTSIILFVLAGILIGHSFWYQDRSGDQEKIHWLEKRYLQARTVARRRKQAQREFEKVREQLDSLRRQQEASAQSLAEEQRRSEMLVSQLQEVLRAKSSLESALEQQADTISQLSELAQNASPELETRVQVLQGELNQSKDALKHADQDLHARSVDLDVIRGQRDTLQQELVVTHQQVSQVEETVAKQEIKLTSVREQLEELLPLRAESAKTCLTIAEQRLELAAQQEEVERLRDQSSGVSEAGERRAA